MTPISTATDRPTHLAVVPEPAELLAPTHYLVCDDCDLRSGPMAAAEGAFLARIHDQLQHRGQPTAHVDAAADKPAPTPHDSGSDDASRLVA
ncbi:MAG: hypothetical protein U0Q15_04050 [Kineosporiaceae bacterium]